MTPLDRRLKPYVMPPAVARANVGKTSAVNTCSPFENRLLAIVYSSPAAMIDPDKDENPSARPNALIDAAAPMISQRRSTRSMIGSESADPTGYPINVSEV